MIWCACVMVALAPALAGTHPHDEPEIYTLKGTVTKVDVANRAFELDTLDPETKAPRNLLLFVDARARLRNGKAPLNLVDLRPGHRLRATVERQHDETGRERWRAFQVSVEMRT